MQPIHAEDGGVLLKSLQNAAAEVKGDAETDEEDDYDDDDDWYLDDATGKLTKGCTWNGGSNYQVCKEFCKSVLSACLCSSVCVGGEGDRPGVFLNSSPLHLFFMCVFLCV